MRNLQVVLFGVLVLLAAVVGAVDAQPGPASKPAVGTGGAPETPPAPLRLAIIGMVHGHVEGPLWQASDRDDIEIVGIYEPDAALFERFRQRYGLAPELYYDDLGQMLDQTQPEAASVMTSTADHVMAVEACAPRGIHTLVEKPLAIDAQAGRRLAELAEQHDVLVLTNFETSWYASVRTAYGLTRAAAGSSRPANTAPPQAEHLGPIRRMVFRHGHGGPQEIGCSPEFLAWLTDPAENGGGAITDFGCYGAVLSGWMMGGARPQTVSAITRQTKPERYPLVDDDATILVTYPSGTTAVIQASWAWTHDNKDMDVFTDTGSIHCGKWDELILREPDGPRVASSPEPKPPHLSDEWTYLRHVVRGECEVDPLSSLELNLLAVEILDAARESAETGAAVPLTN